MKNFNEIVTSALETADARKKAFVELKKAAPDFFRRYAEAMKELGYKNSYFKGRLFHDQAVFTEHESYDEEASYLCLDFETEQFTEATGEEMNRAGELVNVYDGKLYELDFSTNTNGVVLLDLVSSLPDRISRCEGLAKKQTERVQGLLER